MSRKFPFGTQNEENKYKAKHFMISLIIIEVTQKIRIMENIMNRIFQKFLQSVIDLSSVGAKCLNLNRIKAVLGC